MKGMIFTMSNYIRLVKPDDSGHILKIYAPYVTDTAFSFEIDVPSPQEFAARVQSISSKYPYLVYISDDKIIGYAYASSHKERAAYCYDVDVSVYISSDYHGSGAAYELYKCLFDILYKLGYYNAYAGITVPNNRSIRFHEKHGFKSIGTYHKTGYKFDSWHDVLWMEKEIRDHDSSPNPLKSITELPNDELVEAFKIQ